MPDELLDIVDNNDKVIGQELRSIIHQCGLQHRGAHILLFTQDGKLLVQKRSRDRASYPSAWDCSVSEHVKSGESYLEAAMRGAKEEMGVEGVTLKPLVRFRMNYGPNDNEISALFKGTVDPTAVRFDPLEVESVEYFDIPDLAKKMQEDSEKFCVWFVQIMNWYLDKPSELQVLAD